MTSVDTPAHIAIVDGVAAIDREGESQEAVASMPLVAGDRLRTERGRLEVLFPDGTTLDLDEFASVELQAPTLLRVTAGRVLLTITGSTNPGAAAHFQIDTPSASATTDGPGEYRIAVLAGAAGGRTELAVLRGAGALMTEAGSMPLRAGERSVASDNGALSPPQGFNSARLDAFDQWAAAGRQARLGSSASVRNLPEDLRMYGGTFDRSGSWQHEAQYGNVWYPTVPEDWRPYYNGYWSAVPTYGWTWIGVDPWTWPTHHYGRWGHARNRWFWIPDRRWAAAWVSWGAAPGYVSWSPLGYDNRPVFGLAVTAGTARSGWVVVPRQHFGRGRYASRYALSPRTVRTSGAFVVQSAPPVPAPRAVRRGNASVGAGSGYRNNPGNGARPGARTVPRPGSQSGSVPGYGNAVPRYPGAVSRPGSTAPIYQPAPGRPAYQRRSPAERRAPGGVTPVAPAGAQPQTVPPAPGPVRSPYRLSSPLGLPPAAPGSPSAAPTPRAVPRGAQPATGSVTQPATRPSGAAAPQATPRGRPGTAVRSPGAGTRQGTPGAAAAPAPAPRSEAAPPPSRRHDPDSRRPR
jgi:hypothetical protein